MMGRGGPFSAVAPSPLTFQLSVKRQRDCQRERERDSSQTSIMVFSSFEGGIKDNLLSWDFMHLWRMSLFTNNDLIEGFQQPDPSRPNYTFVICPFDTEVVCPVSQNVSHQKNIFRNQKGFVTAFRKYILCIHSQNCLQRPEMQIHFS